MEHVWMSMMKRLWSWVEIYTLNLVNYLEQSVEELIVKEGETPQILGRRLASSTSYQWCWPTAEARGLVRQLQSFLRSLGLRAPNTSSRTALQHGGDTRPPPWRYCPHGARTPVAWEHDIVDCTTVSISSIMVMTDIVAGLSLMKLAMDWCCGELTVVGSWWMVISIMLAGGGCMSCSLSARKPYL